MITASGITKSFSGLQVLKGVDFQVGKSEIVSIVGASGAGKTTLLNILGTLLRPDGGTLEINGVNPFSLSDGKLSAFRGTSLGFVFQFHHLLPEFTALENVMLPSIIAGNSKNKARQTALALLDEVGLSARTGHFPSELSGGESQRVAIARAIVNSPAVLLADEPSGNLDSVTREEIHSLFFRLRERFGQTTVIVTHDNSLASMCDRSLTMKDGQFI